MLQIFKQSCNPSTAEERAGAGELMKTGRDEVTTHLYQVVMWSVVVVGSRCWPVWAPAVSQGRREPCRRRLSTVVSWRYSLPVYEVMELIKPTSDIDKLHSYFCAKARDEAEKAKKQTKAGDIYASGTATKHRAERKKKRRVFTRGRGMLHPSVGLGGRRAGLAGGGVSSPADKLDSGELIGVSVTEEISRQESDLML